MNKTETKTIPLRTETLIRSLTGLCEVYEKELTETLIQIWKNALYGMSEESFHAALTEYMRGPSGGFMPKPGQIYALANPEGDKKSEAMLLAERIFFTLGSCGGDTQGADRAKARLPEIAWAYIENRGGWSKFCRDMQVSGEPEGVLKAHARDAMMGLIDRKKAGKTLVLGHEQKGLTALGDMTQKRLPEDEE